MLTSWSEVSTPAELSMKSVLIRPPAVGELDPAALGQTEVAALTHDRAPELASVHANRVVGLVAGVGVRLGLGLHVGADAAVPEQVDGRLQHRAHQLRRRERRHVVLDSECGADLGGERDRLLRPREDAATRGDQAAVVVLPRAARQLEQPLALGVRRGRVGRRVQEDVAVVEGRDQPGVLGAQHAVAEHVAGHVTDADGREVIGLAVDAHLAEMPLHGDPGALGGDPHRLVVVADRATGGERVAQPEAVVHGHLVGDVGERRRPLVGRHHEVGVVGVVTHHVDRRHDGAADPVVGDVEQGGDERAVAADALGQPGVTITRVGQLLADEPALRAHGHDHGVLDHLRLDQSQHLGAEVVATVGPAQPTPGDGAEAQVDALHPR